MAWSKLDEDRAAADEVWSAFLLKGLIDNANAYGTDLAPGFSAVWRADTAPTWASLQAFAGGVVTFNVGNSAKAVEFVVTCAHHPTLVGYVQIVHPASGAFSNVTVAAGATSFTVELEFNSPQSGPQEFQLLYRSSVAEESIGHFNCYTAIGNQIAVRNYDGTFTVAANAGRQFWALQLTGTNVDDGNPIAPGGFHWYQIGRVNELVNAGGGQHADGYLITWPDVETNPPILRSTSTFVQQAPNYVVGDIFEISFLALYSVSLRVTESGASQVPMVYAHDLAQSVSMLPRAQRAYAGNSLIQVAACPAKEIGFLGCVVSPSSPLIKAYASDQNGTVSLLMRFRACTYLPLDANPTLTVTVVEVLPGGTFNTLITQDLGPSALPLIRPRRSFSDGIFSALPLNGVNLGAEEWGMADAGFSSDLARGPIVSTTLTFPVEKFATSALYAIQLDTTAPIYVSAFYLGGG